MAYAAVTSLKHTIHRLHIEFTKSEASSLKLLRSTLSTLEGLDDRKHININRTLINALEAEILEAAYKLEDACEFYMLNRSRARSDSLDQMWPPIAECDLESLEQEKISFFTKVNDLAKEYTRVLNNPLPQHEEEVDAEDLGGNKTAAVGLSDLVEKITTELREWHHGLRSASVVGMAGIGKTRLAREIYHHPLIRQHFKFTVWVRIGQHPDAERVLRDVVAQVEHQSRNNNLVADQIEPKPRNNHRMEEVIDGPALDAEFKRIVQDEKCFIVLDDVWSTSIFEYLLSRLQGWKQFLVTTRLEEVAESDFWRTTIHRMPFLDQEQSWSLLRQIVFADDESISSPLEEAGRMIADYCEGLPLLILTVAHILRGNDITEEYWKKVADKKTNTFTDAFEQISKVLILSYDYLPQSLKACFLYMGVFPQTFEIPITKLLRLWTVEAFSECETYNSLGCVTKLVSNNIVIVYKRSSDNRIKSSKLHSAYWYLCVKEARKVEFFHALNNFADTEQLNKLADIRSLQRRLSFQNNVLFGIKDVYDSMAKYTPSPIRSLLCTGKYQQYPVRICFNMILLKVLDALAIRFYEFPSEVLNLLQLSYLALTHDGVVPSSISKLQKMWYLILHQHHNIRLLRHSTYMPEEIWDMKELMHLQIMGCNLPDPPNERVMLEKLKTLQVNADSCTEKVFKGICCLEKLRIKIELEPDAAGASSCFEHIGQLLKLMSFECVVVNPRLMSQVVAPPDHLSKFSKSLKKLSLNGLGYSWKNISVIGLLPNLEVLKLRCNAFQGPEWKLSWHEFRRLVVLVLEDIDLVHMTLKDDCTWMLPMCKRLILGHCYKLKEIPIIPTLRMLEVVDCSPSLVASAEQLRNSFVQVEITSSWNFH